MRAANRSYRVIPLLVSPRRRTPAIAIPGLVFGLVCNVVRLFLPVNSRTAAGGGTKQAHVVPPFLSVLPLPLNSELFNQYSGRRNLSALRGF
jgi:hypothetical protein